MLLLGGTIERREDRERVYGAARRRIVIVPGAEEEWTPEVVIAVGANGIRVTERDR